MRSRLPPMIFASVAVPYPARQVAGPAQAGARARSSAVRRHRRPRAGPLAAPPACRSARRYPRPARQVAQAGLMAKRDRVAALQRRDLGKGPEQRISLPLSASWQMTRAMKSLVTDPSANCVPAFTVPAGRGRAGLGPALAKSTVTILSNSATAGRIISSPAPEDGPAPQAAHTLSPNGAPPHSMSKTTPCASGNAVE